MFPLCMCEFSTVSPALQSYDQFGSFKGASECVRECLFVSMRTSDEVATCMRSFHILTALIDDSRSSELRMPEEVDIDNGWNGA